MKRVYVLAAVAILFWSTVATVTKLLMGSLSSVQVLAVSAGFAALFLFFVNLFSGNLKRLSTYRLRDYLRTLLIGIPGTFLYYMFYYAGAARLPASQAFIINYLWPIMSVVFACLILGERLTVRKVLAILISFLGVMIVMGGGLLSGGFSLPGALFCVLGAISYGIYTALNQRYSYDKRLSMMFYYATAFLLSMLLLLVKGELPVLTLPTTLGLAFNGVLTMAVANTAWLMALGTAGNTAKVSNLAYITPFLSLVWAAISLREAITLPSLIGLTVIVLGILLQLRDRKR